MIYKKINLQNNSLSSAVSALKATFFAENAAEDKTKLRNLGTGLAILVSMIVARLKCCYTRYIDTVNTG